MCRVEQAYSSKFAVVVCFMSRETVADEPCRKDFLFLRKVESKKWLFCMCVGVARESTSSLLRESVLESLKMVGWLVGRSVACLGEGNLSRNPVLKKKSYEVYLSLGDSKNRRSKKRARSMEILYQ